MKKKAQKQKRGKTNNKPTQCKSVAIAENFQEQIELYADLEDNNLLKRYYSDEEQHEIEILGLIEHAERNIPLKWMLD